VLLVGEHNLAYLQVNVNQGHHVSVIDNVNQGLISKEKKINRILKNEEEKSEKRKTIIIDQRKKSCV
jgi:hypothetical protein